MHGAKSHVATTEALLKGLTDKHMKMLNLAHAWLDAFLPHVLSKIDRVNYGLLSAEQTYKDMPTSRKLLAVPFLGKECRRSTPPSLRTPTSSSASRCSRPVRGTAQVRLPEGARRPARAAADAGRDGRDAPGSEDLQPLGDGRRRPRPRHARRGGRGAGREGVLRRGPLQLIDVVDGEQMTILQRLLRYAAADRALPLVVHLPADDAPPDAQGISANAQELGGDNDLPGAPRLRARRPTCCRSSSAGASTPPATTRRC